MFIPEWVIWAIIIVCFAPLLIPIGIWIFCGIAAIVVIYLFATMMPGWVLIIAMICLAILWSGQFVTDEEITHDQQ